MPTALLRFNNLRARSVIVSSRSPHSNLNKICDRTHRKCILADPNSQIATLPQAFIVLGAVGHTTLLLRDLGATISV